MALYAFDGTGNEDKEGTDHDSNVLFFFNGYDAPLKNQDPEELLGTVYMKGIGARAKEVVGKSVAEAFGIGGHARIKDAIARLERNVAAGDTVIDVVGFSRGAALAVSFANKLFKSHPEMEIRFIGVFDIVAEFGVAGARFNAGHDMSFPPNVKRCYHAMALDEHRMVFQLTRLTGTGDATEKNRLVEVWFRGVHSDVGGSDNNKSLNWISLNWMYENAIREGLPILAAAVQENLDRKAGDPKVTHKFEVGPMRKIRDTDVVHVSVQVDKGNFLFPHNNPKPELARMDDGGNLLAGGAAAAKAGSSNG